AVTVQNTAPVITSVTITPANPLTTDILTANVVANDADGDPVTVTYQWFVNGAPVVGATGSTFDLSVAGQGDKGDTVTVQATPNDGTVNGAMASDTVTVGNTAPTATVTITPANPQTNDIVTANVTTIDADGDAVTVSYQWFVNGVAVAGATS